MQAPTSGGGSDFKPAPEGNQVGYLIGLYHFGPQEYTYMGEQKTRNEIRVMFELPNAKAKFGDSDEERPYVVGKSGTYSMNEKAFLRKVVEACLGKKMADDEAERFPIESVIGKPCLVNITHYDSNGKTFAGIENVSPLPQGMTVPERHNSVTVFDVTNYSQDQYSALPDWMKEKVDKSGFAPKKGDDRIAEEDRSIKLEDIPF